MSAIVKLVQGSAEWHEHRRNHRNASETPAVLGVSPWMTPYQLWQIKLGLVEPEVTPAMLHGTQLEPQARAAYEALTGHVMQPLVLVDGEFSASLDGLTLERRSGAGDQVPVQAARFDAVEDGRGGALAGALRMAGPAPAHGDEGRDRRRVRL